MVEGGPEFDAPSNDIYTMLTFISTLFLLVGIIFLAVRGQQLFGSWLPLGGP